VRYRKKAMDYRIVATWFATGENDYHLVLFLMVILYELLLKIMLAILSYCDIMVILNEREVSYERWCFFI
jgi:hypothetical protein